jgi:hypothetical protein
MGKEMLNRINDLAGHSFNRHPRKGASLILKLATSFV